MNNSTSFDSIENIQTKKDFLKKIQSNPELLNSLPDEKLDVIIKYYEETIKEKLKKLNYITD